MMKHPAHYLPSDNALVREGDDQIASPSPLSIQTEFSGTGQLEPRGASWQSFHKRHLPTETRKHIAPDAGLRAAAHREGSWPLAYALRH